MLPGYRITIDGTDVTSNFDPHLLSLTITDSDGGKSDQLDIVLDDSGGRLLLPRTGASISADLWWIDPPAWVGSGAVHFEGKTDEPESSGSRHDGHSLSLSAKSADLKGKGKHKRQRHKDRASFRDVASEWGSEAGFTIVVDDAIGGVTRDWWHMANESFFAWGARIADELGATFKVSGTRGVFLSRNASASASGKALQTVEAAWGRGLISWRLAPLTGRGLYKAAKVRWYDPAAARWNVESADIGDDGAEADLTDTLKAADQDRAKKRAGSNAADAKRKKGGGDLVIDGDPGAMAQALVEVSGVRDGIDGTYVIKTARHAFQRGRGWTTSIDVELPGGAAGQDKRRATTGAVNTPGFASPAQRG